MKDPESGDMDDDCPLFKPHTPLSGKSKTSRKTATMFRESVATGNRRVYAFTYNRGTYGATQDEISIGIGMEGKTCSARCHGLRGLNKKVHIFPPKLAITTRERETSSKAPAFVYVAWEFATEEEKEATLQAIKNSKTKAELLEENARLKNAIAAYLDIEDPTPWDRDGLRSALGHDDDDDEGDLAATN